MHVLLVTGYVFPCRSCTVRKLVVDLDVHYPNEMGNEEHTSRLLDEQEPRQD